MAKQVIYRRGTTAQHVDFVGANGEVTVDTVKHVTVVHDGVTAGGWPAANATAVNSALSVLTANAANQAASIISLTANAATQANTLANLSANAASQQASINAFILASNASAIFANIAGVQANVTAANANISILFGNATVQSEAIQLANANIIALQSGLVSTNANIANIVIGSTFVTQTQFTNNLTAVNTAITSLSTISATTATVAGVQANVTAANLQISSLQANIAAANLVIANIAISPALISTIAVVVNNAYATSFQLSSNIGAMNANINAANAAIAVLQSNAATQASLLSTLTSNAAVQSTELDTLTSNAAVQANVLTDLLSNAVTQQTSLGNLLANSVAIQNAVANINANLDSVSGNVSPSANVTYDLGTPDRRWRDLYLSGNTINLGGATLTATAAGTVAIPGVSEARSQPLSIEYTGSAPYNDDGAFPSTPVIVDYLTFYLSHPATNATTRAGFVPAVYAAQMSGGNIIGVTIVSPGIYNSFYNAATLNGDNMIALPAGTPLTYGAIWAAAQAATAPFGPFRAGVLSTSTVVASSPALYVGGVALAVEAGNVLTVNGQAVLSNSSDATITTTGNITANNIIGDNLQGLTGSLSTLETINFNVENISALGNAGVNIGAGGFNNLVVLDTDVMIQNVNLSVNNDLIIGGNIIPAQANIGTLGTPDMPFNHLYVGSGSITIGNATLSVVGGAIQSNLPFSAPITATNLTVSGTSIDFASGGYIAETEVLDGNLNPAGYYGISVNSSDDGIISLNALDSNSVVMSSVFVTNSTVQLNVANSVPGGSSWNWIFDSYGGLSAPSQGIVYLDNPGALQFLDPSASALSVGTIATVGNLGFSNNTFQITAFTGNAVTLDITDTNGLTNLYYPTFVEFRDVDQIVRADQDFTYKSDENLLTVGNLQVGNITFANARFTITSAYSIAMGYNSGYSSQGDYAIAIGNSAGRTSQGIAAIAIGDQAGNIAQGSQAVAIGTVAGQSNQGTDAVAIGSLAGGFNQSAGAIAIGQSAGVIDQGLYAVAIGSGAGYQYQANNSIAITATGTQLSPTESGFYIDPVRNDTGNVSTALFYNISTKEITTANIMLAGFTMANYQHWTSNVSTIGDALNQLAERIWNIENP